MKALMTIFPSIGVMAVLILLYAVLLVGCEKKIIFHPANSLKVIGTRVPWV